MMQFSLSRCLAVAERDLRRFRRNSKLMVPMALMPIIYLVILGKSMGGDLHNLPVAVVVQDHGAASAEVLNRLVTMAQSRDLFQLASEPDPNSAVRELRQGRYKGVVIVPPGFSDRYARGEPAQLGVVVDNTDNTAANVIVQELRGAFLGVNTELRAVSSAPVFPGVQVERVDVYGHKEFMQYLVPGVIALALFFVAMLAGGIILVDDRARGIHEGYFVTPLSSLDLVLGLTISAVSLSMIIGTIVLVASIVIARFRSSAACPRSS
jgi:ABC-2 type transport system permease protein